MNNTKLAKRKEDDRVIDLIASFVEKNKGSNQRWLLETIMKELDVKMDYRNFGVLMSRTNAFKIMESTVYVLKQNKGETK